MVVVMDDPRRGRPFMPVMVMPVFVVSPAMIMPVAIMVPVSSPFMAMMTAAMVVVPVGQGLARRRQGQQGGGDGRERQGFVHDLHRH